MYFTIESALHNERSEHFNNERNHEMNSLLKRWCFAFLSVVFISCSLQALLIEEDLRMVLKSKGVNEGNINCFIQDIKLDIERKFVSRSIFPNRNDRTSFNLSTMLNLARWTLEMLDEDTYLSTVEMARLELKFNGNQRYKPVYNKDKIFGVIIDILVFRHTNTYNIPERCRICREQLSWYCTNEGRNRDCGRDDIHNECRQRW